MIQFKFPSNLSTQVILLVGMMISILIIYTVMLLQPAWQKLADLRQQSLRLNQQWLKQQAVSAHNQQIQRDSTVLQYSYSAKLQSLHQSLSAAEISTQINSLAKSHAFIHFELKPLSHQFESGLQKQVFSLSFDGSETKILNFLNMLMHQSWLLEIQQLSLVSSQTGEVIQLQANMVTYDD